MEEELKYPDFTLRKFVKNQDDDALYNAIGDPLVVRHMASKGITKGDCSIIINESLAHWDEYKIGSWAVEIDGRLIGWAGFKKWEANEYEILIVLAPAFWGVGKKIYTALIHIAKNEFKLDRIIIILPNSRKTYLYVINKAGFKHQGQVTFNENFFQKFTLAL